MTGSAEDEFLDDEGSFGSHTKVARGREKQIRRRLARQRPAVDHARTVRLTPTMLDR